MYSYERVREKALRLKPQSVAKSKKLLIHSIRYLLFGIRLASTGLTRMQAMQRLTPPLGVLTDMGEALEYWREVADIYFEKDLDVWIETRYLAHCKPLMDQFVRALGNVAREEDMMRVPFSVPDVPLANMLSYQCHTQSVSHLAVTMRDTMCKVWHYNGNWQPFYPEDDLHFFAYPDYSRAEVSLTILCLEKILSMILNGTFKKAGAYAILPLEMVELILETVARSKPELLKPTLLRWFR